MIKYLDLHPTFIIRPKSGLTFGWKELWRYRELLYFFTWRDIKVRYKQAFLGVLWTLLQPLAMMMILVLVLSKGLGLDTGQIPAPIYYLSGLLIWNLFSQSVSGAANAMVSNAGIIRKIYFPRLIIPISSILTASFDFMISLILFIGIGWWYHFTEGFHFPMFTVLISFFIAWMITVVTAFGLGTLLSAVNVKYRDVRYALPFLIQSIFFVTPVMFDSKQFSQPLLQFILELNPLNYAIQSIRETLIGTYTEATTPFSWYLLVLLITLYFLGIYVFRRMEAYFADIV